LKELSKLSLQLDDPELVKFLVEEFSLLTWVVWVKDQSSSATFLRAVVD
jgi:hypothetical protein